MRDPGPESLDEHDDDASDLVEAVLADCLAAPEEQRASAIDRACVERPDLAHELRARVAVLRGMGIGLGPERGFPEQLGDFRLLRVLGGGGMGIVYLAVQTSLQRDVALKLIRPEHLFFEGARARFRREAEAVARLHHPGIVPIHAVGEARGIPYFAMEFVRGGTLAEALRELRSRAPESLSGPDLHALVAATAGAKEPLQDGSTFDGSWVQACLRIARQVADALHHAHEKKLVHRDVKPSNIALAPDGRALLLDFGLTRFADGQDMTRSGSTLGTLHYMSPEQVGGARAVDAQSDVYSLGVTLYEMLALQLPFRGADEMAVRQLVLDGQPDSIRSRNPRVEADVETVVLTAIDRDPERRYASCADFARDLGHLLAHRPIEARRPGAALRARRWLQRHPAAGTALVLGPVLVLGASAALVAGEKRHSRALERALTDTRIARDAAQESSERAKSEADTARQALDFVIGMFTPHSAPTGSAKIDSVAGILAHGESGVIRELHGDARSQARMFTMIGRLFRNEGDHAHALELLERALQLWESGASVGNEPYMAETLVVMGESLNATGRIPEACARYRQALSLWPAGDEWARERDFAFGSLARLERRASGRGEIESFARAALENALAEPVPDPRAVGRCRADLGLALLGQYRYDEAATELQLAHDALIRPDSPPDLDTITLLQNLSNARQSQGRLDEAEALSSRAVDLARQIYPARSEVIGIQLFNRGLLARDRGDATGALAMFRESASVLGSVLPANHFETLGARSQLAEFESRVGSCADAEEAACAVLRERESWEHEYATAGYALAALARCARTRTDLAESERLWRSAICLFHRETSPGWQEARAFGNLAQVTFEEGRDDEAREIFERALVITRGERFRMPRSLLDRLVHACRSAGRESEAQAYEGWIEEVSDSPP